MAGQSGNVSHGARLGWLVLALVAACGERVAPQVPLAPPGSGLASELYRRTGPQPPADRPEICWSSDVTPALIETVTEQVLVIPEVRAPDGTQIMPATYRTETRQRIVRDRTDVWFRVPCPEVFTADYIATVQRALKARGFYNEPVSGVMDAATIGAIRRFQALQGLDSGILSLAAARQLGLALFDTSTTLP